MRAQLSLEYLLLLAAFFSVLLLMLPLIQKTYALALFGLDASQALAFSQSFSETAKQISVFSEGSRLQIEATPLHSWNVSVKGKKFAVAVFSEALGKTKIFEQELALETANFSIEFSEKKEFFLSKQDNRLVIDSDS